MVAQAFRTQVKNTLEHLHDSAALEVHPLLAELSEPQPDDGRSGADRLRALLTTSIEGLRPRPELPPNALAWRAYQALLSRYVQGMAIGDIERALGISRRQVQRELRKALDALSALLWQRLLTKVRRKKQMSTNPPTRQAPKPNRSVIRWLLDSDPSIRWQVMRDLTGAPAEEVAAERARVAREGTGARLLALQAPDGRWGGAAWNRGWDSTMHVLMLLRDLGLDPASEEARRAVGLVRDRVTWQGCGPPECDLNPFFAGEIEPCINGQVAAVGAYFGQNVRGIVERLLGEQLGDGGWNCEAPSGSTRSSFNTTICVLEALLEHELTGGGNPAVTEARLRGQVYLLERRLFRRLSTGEAIERDRKGDAAWTRFAFPTWWHYDVLRGLEYLRRAGVAPDDRVAEAIELVESKRDGDGRWPLETQYPGQMPVEIDESEGRPSRWNTLRALRVLDWYWARD